MCSFPFRKGAYVKKQASFLNLSLVLDFVASDFFGNLNPLVDDNAKQESDVYQEPHVIHILNLSEDVFPLLFQIIAPEGPVELDAQIDKEQAVSESFLFH